MRKLKMLFRGRSARRANQSGDFISGAVQPIGIISSIRAQLPPIPDVIWRGRYFPRRPADKDQGVFRAGRNAQAAADTIGWINQANIPIQIQSIKLAAFKAIPASHTKLLIDNDKEIRSGNHR